MKIQGLTLLFTVMASVAVAQDYTFKVLANKGSNEVKTGAGWVPLKTGASLKETDELKITDNAYLGLVHNSGRPIEIKEAGNYKVKDLADRVGKGTGVINKYTDFILSSTAENKKNRLSATGAVDRGESAPIHLLLPDNQYAAVYNQTATVSWESTKATGPYVVTVRNLFEDELSKFETNDNSFKIDLNDARYAKENAVMIEVRSKADPRLVSKQRLIKRLGAAEKANVDKTLAEINSDVTEQTALNKFILAGFYEEKGLLIDATSAYEEAIALAPDVQQYKDSFDEFLIRHNMKK